MFVLHILLGDEFLDLVDRESFIDSSAGTRVFAVFAADASADRGERIVLFDELESVLVLALSCHVYIALDRDMRGTGDLAGSCACRPGLDASVFVSVVFIPFFLTPDSIIRQLVLRIFNLSFGRAELLSEPYGSRRAGLDTFAAGDALCRVALGCIRRSREVRSVEKLGCPESIADTDSAVADRKDLVLSVNIGDLMDIAPVLCLLNDLHGLIIGNIAPVSGLAAVIRKIAYSYAPVRLNISGTLVADTLLLSAGADRYAYLTFIFFEPV